MVETGKNYPSFVFAVRRGNVDTNRTVALEIKRGHLDNPNTAYKREVLNPMSENFLWYRATDVGPLELVVNGETVECTLILMKNVQTQLPYCLASGRAS
jgi:type III restriction enzyme